VADDCPPAEVFGLLDDEYARSLLSATSHRPMTVPELTEQCEMSATTVYRRLNQLERYGLVESEQVPDPDGNHKQRFEAQLDRLVVRLEDGEFNLSVETASTTQQFADAFTDLWEGI
jgi:predicted transcriptional regulator